ncbi:SRR1-like protein [Patella vulgata]|uniref:SRR1-like protein n=1 Tax=Patella vulgata TaxID=6465 RepID=UPI00217F2688|nr:SRR1-like protein [Patella vulgata]
MNNSDDFTTVKHKRGKKFKTPRLKTVTTPSRKVDDECDESELLIKTENLKRKQLISRDIFKETKFFKEVYGMVKAIKYLPRASGDYDLVVFGLGNFSSSLIAKQQLDLALALRSELNISHGQTLCYDPVFTSVEIKTLQDLEWIVPEINQEGKGQSNKTCIYYLPHCHKILYNNLLWANWSKELLSKIVIIGNSFSSMVERTPKRLLEKNGNYILKIEPYMSELPLPDTYSEKDVFNDTSIHTFPIERLQSLPTIYWEENIEPIYSNEETDFIRDSSHL